MNKDPESPATGRQTWGIRCASGLDVREIGLTKGEASHYLGQMNDEDEVVRIEAVFDLVDKGGQGKPKLPKARK
jgi:hypothetical protein